MRAATTPATMPAIDLVLKGADEGGDATRVTNGVSDPAGFVAGDVPDGGLGDVPDVVSGGGGCDEELVVPDSGGGVLEGSLTFAANFIPIPQCK